MLKQALTAIKNDDIGQLKSIVGEQPELLGQVFMGRFTLVNFAARHHHNNALKCLVQQDAEINPKDDSYDSPLYAACLKENWDAIRWLLENGADIDGPNCPQPIVGAIDSANADVVKFLIESGAKTRFSFGELGYTPLSYAETKGDSHAEIVRLLENASA